MHWFRNTSITLQCRGVMWLDSWCAFLWSSPWDEVTNFMADCDEIKKHRRSPHDILQSMSSRQTNQTPFLRRQRHNCCWLCFWYTCMASLINIVRNSTLIAVLCLVYLFIDLWSRVSGGHPISKPTCTMEDPRCGWAFPKTPGISAETIWYLGGECHLYAHFSSHCFQHCLMNSSSVIESITNYREPQPEFEAIYLIMPTTQNVDRIIKDFSTKRQYAAAHLFFIEGIYMIVSAC